MRRPQYGLTLIELLVTLAVLAFASSVVILSMATPRNESRAFAERFAAKTDAAASYAILSGRLLGMEVTPSGYTFYEYRNGAWRKSEDHRFQARDFPEGLAASVDIADGAQKNERERENTEDENLPAPNIFFSATGQASQAAILFRSEDDDARVVINQSGDVRVIDETSKR